MKRKTTKPGNMRAFIYSVSKKMRKVRRKGTKMKVGDKVQLRRRISQKGGKTRLATEKTSRFLESIRTMCRSGIRKGL